MTAPREDETTGLPWPRSWGGVYAFVMAIFVVWVGILAALARMFS